MSTYEEEEIIMTPTLENGETHLENREAEVSRETEKKEEPVSVISNFKDPEEERKQMLREKEKEAPPPDFAKAIKKRSDGEFVDPEKLKENKYNANSVQFSFQLKKVSNAPQDIRSHTSNDSKSDQSPSSVMNIQLKKTADPEAKMKPKEPSDKNLFASVKLKKAEEGGQKDNKDQKELPDIVKPSDLMPSIAEKRRTIHIDKPNQEQKPVFSEVKLKSSGRPESIAVSSNSNTNEPSFASIRLKKAADKPRVDDKAAEPIFAGVKLRSAGEAKAEEVEDPRQAGKPKKLTSQESNKDLV